MNKIRYDATAQTVIYKTKMVEGPNRNFEIFDPLDFLAAVTPDPARESQPAGSRRSTGNRCRGSQGTARNQDIPRKVTPESQ